MQKSNQKISYNAPVTITFSFICLIVFIINVVTGGAANEYLFSTYKAPLYSPLAWLRIFTHVFGHESWNLCFTNIAFLLLIGPTLEEKYERKQILTVIVVTAVVTALVHYITYSWIPVCGASGIVFAFIILLAFAGAAEEKIPLASILVLLIFVAHQIYGMFFVRNVLSKIYIIQCSGGFAGAYLGYLLPMISKTMLSKR